MPTIYVLSGPEIGRTHEAGEGALLGRSPDCDVPLRASSVSRHHARLERDGGEWVLVDLGSSNGMRHEGQRVERLELFDGILFALGDLELRFRAEALVDEATSERVPGATPPPPTPPPPAPRTDEPVLEGSGEVELEGTEFLDTPAPARPPVPRGEEPAPKPLSGAARERRAAAEARQAARGRVLAGARGAPSGGDDRVRDAGKMPLRFSRFGDHRGFFTADLAQYPLWVRGLAVLLAVLLFAAVFWIAFRGAGSLRDRASGEGVVETSVDEGS